jgi:hypothetical protein
MYGKGKTTDDPKQAGAWAGAIVEDDYFAGPQGRGAQVSLSRDG